MKHILTTLFAASLLLSACGDQPTMSDVREAHKEVVAAKDQTIDGRDQTIAVQSTTIAEERAARATAEAKADNYAAQDRRGEIDTIQTVGGLLLAAILVGAMVAMLALIFRNRDVV